MGYRNYIGTIPKKEYNKIKSLTYEELFEYYKSTGKTKDENIKDFYIGVYDFGERLYEFGKYVDFIPPKKSEINFFKKKEVEEMFNSDTELKIVTKEFLAYIISNYTEKVKTYYDDILKPFVMEGTVRLESEFMNSTKRIYGSEGFDNYSADITKLTPEEISSIVKMVNHFRTNKIDWMFGNYNLNEDDDSVCSSTMYEYCIFELVKIYKTFDWKRNHMYYYGT